MVYQSAKARKCVFLPCLIILGIAGFACLAGEVSAAESTTDTNDVRTVQPGAPGDDTRVFNEDSAPEASRVVRPGAPGEETQVLTPGRVAKGEPSRIVRPGAPGQASEVDDGPRGDRGDEPVYSEADVTFMKEMILHHAQALQMTALVPDRTETEAIKRMADRMERSQGDEIDQMIAWLERRGKEAPDHLHHMLHDIEPLKTEGHLHHGHDHGDMHGMLSNEQMEELAAASGEEFDKLFLEFMIFHHEGAIYMVHDLMASPAGGQETEAFAFASHVESDQRIEIQRMQEMLDTKP